MTSLIGSVMVKLLEYGTGCWREKVSHTAIWLAILAQLSQQCVGYAIHLLGLVLLYPYSRRVTDFTPVPLGFTVAWGVFIGCAAMGVEPVDMVIQGEASEAYALCCFYLSLAVWTNIYKTVYVHQDIEDDRKQGVKPMAIRLKDRIRSVLSLLAVLEIALFACTGWLTRSGLLYFVGVSVGVAVSLGAMIRKVDLRQPSERRWWLSNATWFVGGSIVLVVLADIWGEDTLQYVRASVA